MHYVIFCFKGKLGVQTRHGVDHGNWSLIR